MFAEEVFQDDSSARGHPFDPKGSFFAKLAGHYFGTKRDAHTLSGPDAA